MSNSDPKPGPLPLESPAMPPSTWAKRTGFRPKFSGESTASNSPQLPLPAQTDSHPDLDAGQPRLRPPPPVSAVTDKDKNDNPPPPPPPPPQRQQPPSGGGAAAAPVKRRRDSNGPDGGANGSGDPVRRPETVEGLPRSMDDDLVAKNLHINYGLRDTPGLALPLHVRFTDSCSTCYRSCYGRFPRGHCKCCLDCTFCVWNHYIVAYFIWVEA